MKYLVVAIMALMATSGQVQGAESDRRPTVTVLYFDNNSNDRSLDPLRKGFADMLITDFSSLGTLRVVEREKLEALLSEIKLGQSSFMDPKTAQRLGRGLGAQYAVAGSFVVLKDSLRVDARAIRVETGEVLLARAVDGKKSDLLALERQLVTVLSEGLAPALAGSVPSKLRQTGPKSFDAFETYSRGLDAKDAGKTKEAQLLFEQAVKSDPTYSAAKTALERVSALGGVVDKQAESEFADIESAIASARPATEQRVAHLLIRFDGDDNPEIIAKQVRLLTLVARTGLMPAYSTGAPIEMKLLPELLKGFPDDPFFDDAPRVIEYLYRKYPDRPETSGLKKTMKEFELTFAQRAAVAAHRKEISEGLPIFASVLSERTRRSVEAWGRGCNVRVMELKASYDDSGFAVLRCLPAEYYPYVERVRARVWDPGMQAWPWELCSPDYDRLNDPASGLGQKPIGRETRQRIDKWIASRRQLDPVRSELRKLSEVIDAGLRKVGKP